MDPPIPDTGTGFSENRKSEGELRQGMELERCKKEGLPLRKEDLLGLDAVERVTATQIVYSKRFKEDCMGRYAVGERRMESFP